MRIAVVHWTGRQVGGAEKYVSTLLSLLSASGHEVALLAELDEPADHPRIPLPPGAPVWFGSGSQLSGALHDLRAWGPDVVYVQITLSVELEAAVTEIAPAIRFAHGYHGTCISATKTHTSPRVSPCDKRFGPACLVHFYPRRCGGLSPLVMLRDYREHSHRLEQLHRYAAVVTNSDHMRREYLNHGLPPQRVLVVPLPVTDPTPELTKLALTRRATRSVTKGERSLLFVGRMDRLKGGLVLLDALPRVSSALGMDVRLRLAGDGPDRANWERRAQAVVAQGNGVAIEFLGRLEPDGLRGLYASSDLLVVPSLWPEPFGLVGPEAGLHGVPAAAFAVGGIPEWLHDGVNGHLATGPELTSTALADAIVRCLRDNAHYMDLQQGAARIAHSFSGGAHLEALLPILNAVAAGSEPSPAGQGMEPIHV